MESIFLKTSTDVEIALRKTTKRTLEDFKALISPSGGKFLEEMAGLSYNLTRKRFGNTIQLYAPLYLSNECQNICTYCAFSFDNKIKRITLTEERIMEEVSVLKKLGFNHILIVTGEAIQSVGMEYFRKMLPLIRPHFSHISFEVQPLDEPDYRELKSLGVNTVLVYQETYNKQDYKLFHPRGKKSNFYFRLETPDRLGKADIHKIGLGVLLGLGKKDKQGSTWRTNSFFCALHLHYLEKIYWKTKFSVSFPRLRPIEIAGPVLINKKKVDNGATNSSTTKYFDEGISDKELVQLICAYRIFNPELELSISTRESESFRDNIINLGVTTMSAGSKTNPGGYSHSNNFEKITSSDEKMSLQQFEISDERSPKIISEMLKQKGFEPVWKDWDRSFELIPHEI